MSVINVNFMKKIKIITFLAVVFVVSFGVMTLNAQASVAPIFSLTPINNSGLFQVTVNADPNAPVQLYYYNQNSDSPAQDIGIIGYTNMNGYFSVPINSLQYNIPSNAIAYVVVDGIGSPTVFWPTYPTYTSYVNPYPVYLSQSNISLLIGQNATISLSGGASSYYIYSNSNSSVASVVLENNNTLSVYANAIGSTNITVYQNQNGNTCAVLYVTVTAPVYPVSPVITYYYPISHPIRYISSVYHRATLAMGNWFRFR